MSPHQRQTVVVWGVVGGATGCGAALWCAGLRVSPAAFLLAMYLAASAVIAGYRWVRRYNTTWPDVAGEQMRELERRRRTKGFSRGSTGG